jgi:histone-lysine N-methyltransferase SETMAR
MLTTGVMLLHDNVRLHTAAWTRALLEYLNWELFDYPPYSPDLALSDYNLFTYPKNYLGSQRINNIEKLVEVVKTWLSSQAAEFFDRGIQKLIPLTTSASIPAVTALRISSSMYVFLV